MWEFFLGVSVACFFAVYILKKKGERRPKEHEAVYARRGEILEYKTRKRGENLAPRAGYSFNNSQSKEGAIPAQPTDRDAFIEYAAGVSKSARDSEPAQMSGFDAENEEEDEKKSKFGALRFFDS